MLWESAGAFFPRDNSHFTRQVAHFTRSWSSGKMLAFQSTCFVFEPVGMRLFLVGAFYQNEPDYYSGKFFSFFFVRPQNVCVVGTFYRTTKSTEPASGITSELLQRVPPFVYSIFNVRYKTGRDYRVPPLNFFSALCDFFSNFLLSPNGPPSSFLIFCSKLKFQKAQRVPPF